MNKRTIYKFPLEFYAAGPYKVLMQKGAEILKVDFQNGDIMIWAIVWPDNDMEEVSFSIYGTGHPFESTSDKYIDTVFDPDGYVWHLFKE